MKLKCITLLAAYGLSSACASMSESQYKDSLITPDGVVFKLNKCSTGEIFSDTTYQVRIAVMVDGRQRVNPRFDFDKPAVSTDMARGASVTVEFLAATWRWACGEMSKEAKLSGHPITPRDEYLQTFADEALRETVDAALRLDRQTTDEGVMREMERARAVTEAFRKREPESWRR